MNDKRNISITRHTSVDSLSTLTINKRHELEIVGILPHGISIEPTGPDDAAKLLFYADRYLKLAEGLAEALRAALLLDSDRSNPDYYDHKRTLERYENLRHKLTPED